MAKRRVSSGRHRHRTRVCRQACVGRLPGDGEPLQRHDMTTFTQLALTSSDPPEPFTDPLRLAVVAYLARFKGSSREHTESDLRCYLACSPQTSTRCRMPRADDFIKNRREYHDLSLTGAYLPGCEGRLTTISARMIFSTLNQGDLSTERSSHSAAPERYPLVSSNESVSASIAALVSLVAMAPSSAVNLIMTQRRCYVPYP